MRRTLVVLLGAVVLTTGCAGPAAVPPAGSPSDLSTSAGSPDRPAPTSGELTRPVSTVAAPVAPSIDGPVPWDRKLVRPAAVLAPDSPAPSAPRTLRPCDGTEFRLLPAGARTSTTDGGWQTTFVLRFSGLSACSTERGWIGVTMTAADGSALPIDSMPAGPVFGPPMVVEPHRLVLGSIFWAFHRGGAPATQLVFTLGRNASAPLLRIPLDGIPPRTGTVSPDNPDRSTAYGSVTSTAPPGDLATLSVTANAPATVHLPSTLRYTVTLTNPTDTSVPLVGCPQFIEQLGVVPLKVPTTVGARGPLNCAQLPRAIAAGSSVTLQMELATAGEIPGPGALTWQLLESGHAAAETIIPITVR